MCAELHNSCVPISYSTLQSIYYVLLSKALILRLVYHFTQYTGYATYADRYQIVSSVYYIFSPPLI